MNGAKITGATSSTYVFNQIVPGGGAFQIAATITNTIGSITSSNAVLVVSPRDAGLVIDSAVILSWSAVNTTGYELQSAPAAEGPWTPVDRPIVAVAQGFEASVRTSNKAAFYRLHKVR